MGQQHLRGVQAAPLETALPGLHESHLADRRCGLQFVEGTGALRPPHALHPFCHRTRRNQHDLVPCRLQIGHLIDPMTQALAIQALAVPGDQRTADLDNPATHLLQMFTINHGCKGS